jgi:hypothetical protein
MKFLDRQFSIASLVVGMTCILSTALWAGGSGFGDDDDVSEDEGPAYFGFVRDVSGGTLPDAKVTVAVKDRGGVVTRTDALGKEIEPKDVEITCDKEGYKQTRTLRRSIPPPDSKIPIETECTMQRGA